jgi:hypothetical protein
VEHEFLDGANVCATCVGLGLRARPTKAYSNSGLSFTRKVINFEAYKILTQAIILWFQMSLLTVLSFYSLSYCICMAP